MTVLDSLRSLAGDALVAVADAFRRRREGFADYEAGDYLMGPVAGADWLPSRIPPADVQAAVADLSDSGLFGVVATILEGWKPLLLRTSPDAAAHVDLLIAELRDRADQFRALETDDEDQGDNPTNLDARLIDAADTFPQFRGKY
jgi:hypothetical protein